jgi:hypothetical protein
MGEVERERQKERGKEETKRERDIGRERYIRGNRT